VPGNWAWVAGTGAKANRVSAVAKCVSRGYCEKDVADGGHQAARRGNRVGGEIMSGDDR
jgi:hypothetical protein